MYGKSEADKVQVLRGLGWAHVLELVQRGMDEDAAQCEGENWTNTAGALYRLGEKVAVLSEEIRRDVAKAEYRDREEIVQ